MTRHDRGGCHEKILFFEELVGKLSKRNSKPNLSCFALTHPDLDHYRSFLKLQKRVTIGKLWRNPRIIRKYESAINV